MAWNRLSPSDVAERLSSKSGLTIEQARRLLLAQAELAYSEASNGFVIPGVGVLIKKEFPERRGVFPAGPKKGQEIRIPAKQHLKFRVSRMAKEMVANPPQQMPDIFKAPQIPTFTFSCQATLEPGPSIFTNGLNYPFTSASDGNAVTTVLYRLPDLSLPTGRIAAGDCLIASIKPFLRSVSPGKYPLALAIAQSGKDERVALAIVRFSNEPIVTWEIALPEGHHSAESEQSRIGYGVDSGTGSICDASILPLLAEIDEAEIGFSDRIIEKMKTTHKSTRDWVHLDSPNGSLAIFSSGYGDGFYSSYFGLDKQGNASVIVTDFGIVNWKETR